MNNKSVDNVLHLKKKLEKGVSFEKTLHILHKLQKIPISIELLSATGIGKTVRNLSKSNDNDIGKTAKLLCMTWKAIVKEQQEQEEQLQSNQMNGETSPISQDQDIDDNEGNEDMDEELDSNHEIPTFPVKNEYKSHYDEEYVSKKDSKSRHHSEDKYNGSETKHSKSHKKHKSNHRSKESPKTEFETLLGMSDEIIKTKKSSSNRKLDSDKHNKNSSHVNSLNNEKKSKHSEKHKVKEESKHNNYSNKTVPQALESNNSLKSLDKFDIMSSLPTPNYKPLPNRELIDGRVEANKRKTNKAVDLSLNVQSKKGRTAVFAGQARTNCTRVYSLEDLCLRVLMDNLDKLYSIGDAPYYLMKPVLQKCNAKQLSKIEHFNPDLADETDELWEEFCRKEHRGQEPDDDENWKELYYRCIRERDDRLKNITKNIVHKQAKALPVRQTQFSENVKTPREVLRKQERSANHLSSSYSSGHSSGHSSTSTSNHVKIVPDKPKVAPLMRKALKLQKARFRR